METVEVVIKLPKEDFDYVQETVRKQEYPLSKFYHNIANGTVLPEKHGKIIDSKQFFIAINKYLEKRKSFSYADLETVINCCTPPIVKENIYENS